MHRYFRCIIITILITCLWTTESWAKDVASINLSLNDAISRAIVNSKEYKKAVKETERTESLRDYGAEQLGFIPINPSGNLQLEMAYSRQLSADLSWQVSKKNVSIEEDRISLDVCNKYWTIQVSQEKLRNAEFAAKKVSLDYQKAKANWSAGMINNATLEGAKTKHVSALSSLTSARNELDKAYEALNTLIGLDAKERPVLTEEILYKPSKVYNIDFEVTRVIESSPSIWLSEQNVALKKQLANTTLFSSAGSYVPYHARYIEVEQAELDAMSAKEGLANLLRKLYYEIQTLEANIPTAEASLKYAEEEYRLAKLRYSLGVATQVDVAVTEESVQQAKQTLIDLKHKHAYLKLAFEKPWAYLDFQKVPGTLLN